MISKTLSGKVAVLFQDIRKSGIDSPQFSKLVEILQPTISRLAKKYPFFWQDDFKQEGNIALLNAVKQYPQENPTSAFIYYAITSIKNRMESYYHSIIERQPIIEGSFQFQDEDDDEEVNPVLQIPTTIDDADSTLLRIDFDKMLNPERLSKCGISPKEIKAFNLHFSEGNSVNDVAENMHLSAGQTSKILSRVRSKAQILLTI